MDLKISLFYRELLVKSSKEFFTKPPTIKVDPKIGNFLPIFDIIIEIDVIPLVFILSLFDSFLKIDIFCIY